jgi:hypothetical protein
LRSFDGSKSALSALLIRRAAINCGDFCRTVAMLDYTTYLPAEVFAQLRAPPRSGAVPAKRSTTTLASVDVALVELSWVAHGAEDLQRARFLTRLAVSTAARSPSVSLAVEASDDHAIQQNQWFRRAGRWTSWGAAADVNEIGRQARAVRLRVFDLRASESNVAATDGACPRGAVPVTLTIFLPHDTLTATGVKLNVVSTSSDASTQSRSKLDEAARLAVSLCGAPIAPGACFTDRATQRRYRVCDDGVKTDEGHTGPALVSSAAKIQINVRNATAAMKSKGSVKSPMVSRYIEVAEGPLARFEALVNRGQSGHASCAAAQALHGVLVTGPAGNGKSAVVLEAAQRLKATLIELQPEDVIPVVPIGDSSAATAIANKLQAAFTAARLARGTQWAPKAAGSQPLPSLLWLVLDPMGAFMPAGEDAQSVAAVPTDGPLSDDEATTAEAKLVLTRAVEMLLKRVEDDITDGAAVSGAQGVAVTIVGISRAASDVSGAALRTVFNGRHVPCPLPSAAERETIAAATLDAAGAATINGGAAPPTRATVGLSAATTIARRLVGASVGDVIAFTADVARSAAAGDHNAQELALTLHPPPPTSSSPFAVALRSGTSFELIGGLTAVKARLHRCLILPITKPDTFRRLNLSPPKGVLLYGPPGCAKTTLVKALCSAAHFTLLYLDCASVLSAYVGESEQRLRDVFQRAREQAPAVIFFDEVDAIAAARKSANDGGSSGMSTRLLATLLTEMDGMTVNRDVCFVGATNLPYVLDSAVLRPGRFDQLIHVPLPSAEDRKDIAVRRLMPLVHVLTTPGAGEDHTEAAAMEALRADKARLGEFAAASVGMSGADITASARTVAIRMATAADVSSSDSVPIANVASRALAELLECVATRLNQGAAASTGYNDALREFIAKHDDAAPAREA